MRILKIVGITLASFVGAFFLLWLGNGVYENYQGDKFEAQTAKFQAALEQPYKDDTVGGKTPEETWSMFLEALKKGDADLASKYFAVEKQAEEKKFLDKEKQIDNFKLLLEQFFQVPKKDPNFNVPDRAYYYYVVKDPKTNQKFSNSLIFYLNPYTKVWKITDL